jgi:hypothetical protein
VHILQRIFGGLFAGVLVSSEKPRQPGIQPAASLNANFAFTALIGGSTSKAYA